MKNNKEDCEDSFEPIKKGNGKFKNDKSWDKGKHKKPKRGSKYEQ